MKCFEKLKDFNDFFEFVAQIHNEQRICLQELLVEDTGGGCEDKAIWNTSIKTENSEESLGNNMELHFLPTDDVFTKNPLLEVEPEENKEAEQLNAVISRKIKCKANKPKSNLKKSIKLDKSPNSSDNDDENEQSLASLLDDIKDEDSDDNDFINVKKRKQKRKVVRAESKRAKKIEKTNEPKRRKGHVLLEENDGLIKKHIKMLCQMCSYIGEDFSILIRHYKEEHAGVKPFIKCCERKLDCPSDILQHAYFHENPDHFKCQECGKTFINNSGLKDHFMKHHEPEENLPYGCDECPRRFSRKNLLAHHKAKHIPKTERSHFCKICNPPKA